LPHCHHYDEQQHILILALIPNAEQISTLFAQTDLASDAAVSVTALEAALQQLGQALGRMHQQTGTKQARARLATQYAKLDVGRVEMAVLPFSTLSAPATLSRGVGRPCHSFSA